MTKSTKKGLLSANKKTTKPKKTGAGIKSRISQISPVKVTSNSHLTKSTTNTSKNSQISPVKTKVNSASIHTKPTVTKAKNSTNFPDQGRSK